MASQINASNSGFGGIVSTGDSSGVLELQAAGTTVATISSTGLAVTGAITTNGIVSSPYAMKNRIINGDMAISQRNAAASHTLPAGNTYGIDRWFIGVGTASVTGQQVAGSGSFPNAYRITGGAGNTGVFFSQRIESANIADLVNTTVTVQITLSASAITSIGWDAYAATVTNNFTSLTSIAGGTISGITSTPNRFTFSFNAGANAANGVQLTFTIGAMTSGTITITGVQLEQGSTATSYEWLPISTELALCQRYFETNFSGVAVPTNNYSNYVNAAVGSNTYAGGSGTNQQILGPIMYSVIKRASPTVTIYSYTSSSTARVSNGWTGADFAANSGVIAISSYNGFAFYNGTGSNITTGGYSVILNYAASAEL